jgi:hypothetical protein
MGTILNKTENYFININQKMIYSAKKWSSPKYCCVNSVWHTGEIRLEKLRTIDGEGTYIKICFIENCGFTK